VHIEHGAKRFYVSGMVQGVGYRYFARRAALRLGLNGYVRNLSDGRVEVYAVGPAAELEALRTDLRHGPSTATVSSVSEEEAPLDPRFAKAFSIEFEQ
jgi:acylphosphatase